MIDIRPLQPGLAALCDAHISRHRLESGVDGDVHFMPFEPGAADGPRGLSSRHWQASTAEPGWERWFLALLDGHEQVVGHVNLKGSALVTGLHRCELGIGIERGHRGAGLGRRLMERAIEFARTEPSLDWVDLRVFGHNQPGLALYRKLGFAEVGTVTDCFRIAGDSVDDTLMTLSVRSGAVAASQSG